MSNIDETLNQRRFDKADEEFTNRTFLPRAEVELLLRIAEARTIIEAGGRKTPTPLCSG